MILDIEKSLKKFIIEILENEKYYIPGKEARKNLNIFNGYLPREKLEEKVPAMSIRGTKGKNHLEERRIKIKCQLILYNRDTEKGYEELYTALQKVIDGVIEKGILFESSEITPEVKWEISEEQPYPYWYGFVIFEVLTKKAYRTDADDWLNGKEII